MGEISEATEATISSDTFHSYLSTTTGGSFLHSTPGRWKYWSLLPILFTILGNAVPSGGWRLGDTGGCSCSVVVLGSF